MAPQKPGDKSTGLPYLIRLFLFWLFIFTMYRFAFLALNAQMVLGNGFLSAAQSLVAGIRLDLSTISYLIAPSFVLWAIHQFVHKSIPGIINSIYTVIILFIITLLAVSNIKMYHEWGALLNTGVFDYLAHPAEVISFISTPQLLLLVLLQLIYFGVCFYIYKKWVTNFSFVIVNSFLKACMIVMPIIVLPVMARGGLQLAPVNESTAYFSETSFYNHVAINPFWYFIHSWLDEQGNSNPYIFMDASVAATRNKNLFSTNDTSALSILKTQRPNIVIIILESWTADIIQALGGENNVTPCFDSLRREGLLFTQMYAAGSRTEHGLISVLSGFPPPPQISILTIPSKAEKLHSLNEIFVSDGYASSFYYGGEIEFANMKSYLVSTHFTTIVDKSNFNKSQWNSKWGAHDEFVFKKQIADFKSVHEPFFSVILTLSSHEPFEVPMQTPFNENTERGRFRKAAYYSDHALGEYFRAAKKESWYDNTLFILVADHGHRLPKKRNLDLPESKRIPLLLYGNVLNDAVRGTTIDKTGNQNDIAAIILNQLHKNADGFPRSKDVLNPSTKDFAYYANNNVLGWISPLERFTYTFADKSLRNARDTTSMAPLNDSIILDAKAYLQTHYQDYLKF